jgi:hypothetical protein
MKNITHFLSTDRKLDIEVKHITSLGRIGRAYGHLRDGVAEAEHLTVSD